MGTLLALGTSTALGQWAQPNQGAGSEGMTAGGLAPPPGGTSQAPAAPPPTQTEAQLEEADREDSGRGLEFVWLNGEVGMTHLGLQTFKANNLVDAGTVKTTQTGPVYGGGLGLRLVFITLGARFRLADLPDYHLWTLNGELGIRIPLGDIEPYFTLGGGYASMGSFSKENIGSGLNSADVKITGYDIRGGIGIDWYVTPVFSLGANLTGELMGLTRPGVDPRKVQGTASGSTGSGSAQGAAKFAADADGSSVGSATTITGVVGLHF